MIRYQEEPHEDIAFNNITFCSPVVAFNNSNESQILNTMFEQGLIPLVIIRDRNNQMFIDIERAKPDEALVLDAVIIPIKFKEIFES